MNMSLTLTQPLRLIPWPRPIWNPQRFVTSLRQSKVTVVKDEDDPVAAYRIKLGNSTLKTPAKNPLRIRDESLALAIANEWRSELGKKKINMAKMHLTALAYTAIDNPFNETKEDIANAMIEYLKFDTVRFRDVENEDLLHRQSRHWDPLISWFEHKFECHLPIEYGDLTNTGSMPQATSDTILRHLCSHERWPLVGVNFITRNLKSFVLATSLMERFLNVNQAVESARLEAIVQAEKWSKVEWEHDIDEQCTSARVAAGTLFYHLSV